MSQSLTSLSLFLWTTIYTKQGWSGGGPGGLPIDAAESSAEYTPEGWYVL